MSHVYLLVVTLKLVIEHHHEVSSFSFINLHILYMPPKKGIVKSGNAGNSSKAASSKGPELPNSEERPLFPPGSKYPASLLHER